jgi:cell division protein FtsW
MSDHSLPPEFVEPGVSPAPLRPSIRAQRPVAPVQLRELSAKPTQRTLGFWRTLDKPLMIISGILLAIGLMMVFSTTFDWSFFDFGDPTVKVVEQARNVALAIGAALIVVLFDYRRLRRLAVPILLIAIAFLIAVLLFGDDVLGGRRSLIQGRFQPGEFAELAMVIYLAAWLSSKNTRIRSITYGLIPFAVLVGIVGGLVVLQPDLSTALVIVIVSAAMFFLAGADIVQMAAAAALALGAGVIAVVSGMLPFYAQGRLDEFIRSIGDITQSSYQILQAFIAFDNGGWFGVGLGESKQKFSGLPAPHTDSIFAVIGEELGIVGAAVVVLLFALLVARGFQLARRSPDPFGALLTAGVTIWIVSKALLNIAVMLALVPPTGLVLPFISFGGSAIVSLMIGIGLMLSVQRVTLLREHTPERRVTSADIHRGRGNGRTRLPRASSGGSAAQPPASS